MRARLAVCIALATVLAAPIVAAPRPAVGAPPAGSPLARAGAPIPAQAAKLPWNTVGARLVPGRLVVVWRHGASDAATR